MNALLQEQKPAPIQHITKPVEIMIPIPVWSGQTQVPVIPGKFAVEAVAWLLVVMNAPLQEQKPALIQRITRPVEIMIQILVWNGQVRVIVVPGKHARTEIV